MACLFCQCTCRMSSYCFSRPSPSSVLPAYVFPDPTSASPDGIPVFFPSDTPLFPELVRTFLCPQHAHRITESQNCRGWKGPLEIIETNPPAKAGSLHQVAQVGVQARLEYLQRRRLHNLPGQPVPVLRHLTVKKFLRTFVRNFLCCSLCPFPLVLSPRTTEKRLASPLWPPHLRYL